MHRLISVLAVGVLATACQTESDLRFTSTLASPTRGVALTESGFDAHVGMIGTTCTIDTNWGCPTADADLPSDEEMILDHYLGDTLGASPEGAHIIRASAWQEDLDVAVPNVRAAALRADGPVLLAGSGEDCALHVGSEAVAAPAEACADDAAYAFDRDGARVVVATGGHVLHVTADGTDRIADVGDLVAYDRALGIVYVSTTNGHEVLALRPNGDLVWSVETDGPISSVQARGTLGQALVMTRGEDTYGRMLRFDGATGDRMSAHRLPDSTCEIAVSDDGRAIACVRPQEVNFYELEDDVETVSIDDTPVASCIDPIQRWTMD